VEPVCLIVLFITTIKVIEVTTLDQFQNLALMAIVELRERLVDFMVSVPSSDYFAIMDFRHLLWQLFHFY